MRHFGGLLRGLTEYTQPEEKNGRHGLLALRVLLTSRGIGANCQIERQRGLRQVMETLQVQKNLNFIADSLKFFEVTADNINVGRVVPLPNRYSSDMPQGQGRCKPAFFIFTDCFKLKIATIPPQTIDEHPGFRYITCRVMTVH
jgi:hypothetical protein